MQLECFERSQKFSTQPEWGPFHISTKWYSWVHLKIITAWCQCRTARCQVITLSINPSTGWCRKLVWFGFVISYITKNMDQTDPICASLSKLEHLLPCEIVSSPSIGLFRLRRNNGNSRPILYFRVALFNRGQVRFLSKSLFGPCVCDTLKWQCHPFNHSWLQKIITHAELSVLQSS